MIICFKYCIMASSHLKKKRRKCYILINVATEIAIEINGHTEKKIKK